MRTTSTPSRSVFQVHRAKRHLQTNGTGRLILRFPRRTPPRRPGSRSFLFDRSVRTSRAGSCIKEGAGPRFPFLLPPLLSPRQRRHHRRQRRHRASERARERERERASESDRGRREVRRWVVEGSGREGKARQAQAKATQQSTEGRDS
ncbi:hypothetical protein Mp_1g26160 [Marchantia polymorpha subsp. ruderalis]|uniref:Uncharacterized protein n=2 Tax=Marchantia polymorpha TaxID=3197 RepID=A0AAF6AUF2_MARPO|nr:hypothetical protein MARPO_0002s0261 [Marchantia polymorpha]BBN00073.1 hypothetical protein Mp_1g26160 [Marchantia polymorpha subsp. ruderalis]|eukprot:PTQ49811.1 hypothetical protein MARPO_0002s0261 [Marchantia polymorpha]